MLFNFKADPNEEYRWGRDDGGYKLTAPDELGDRMLCKRYISHTLTAPDRWRVIRCCVRIDETDPKTAIANSPEMTTNGRPGVWHVPL